MTHYTIDYASLTGIEKHNQALEDIISYLSEAAFNKLSPLLVGISPQAASFQLSFGGIEGYPVTAWWSEMNPGKLWAVEWDRAELGDEVYSLIEAGVLEGCC